jgi:hypothetical protein
MFAGRPRFIALAFICLSRGSFDIHSLNIQLATPFGIVLTLDQSSNQFNQSRRAEYAFRVFAFRRPAL